MIRVSAGHPNGFRLYVLGRRTHHGAIGLVLALVGIALCWHDRVDLHRWIPDFCNGGEK